MNSRPAMYSSTSAGCRYFVDELARHLAQLGLVAHDRLLRVTPFDVPSAFGLTISGNESSRGSRSLPVVHHAEVRR